MEYLKSFGTKKPANLAEIYPGSSKEAIDFLLKTLVFNPKKRISIDEALEHPILKKIRDKKKEIVVFNYF